MHLGIRKSSIQNPDVSGFSDLRSECVLNRADNHQFQGRVRSGQFRRGGQQINRPILSRHTSNTEQLRPVSQFQRAIREDVVASEKTIVNPIPNNPDLRCVKTG